MAVRVTAAEVVTLTGSELESTTIDTFVVTANLIVNANLTGSGLSDDLLKEIEKYLAAHLIGISRERQTQREEIGGDTNEEYAKLGLALDATTYGQMVKVMDTTGALANLGKKKATIESITSFVDY